MARLATLLTLLACSAAAAQSTFTIDYSQRRQTIQGFGATATATWIPEVAALYGKQDFADKIREDLGVSIIRLALPPDIQPREDLDAGTLNLDSFDFTKFNPPANLIQNICKADPSVKVILSIWSPPAWMKTNAETKNGGRLRPDRRAHFAKFCAAACLGFEKTYSVPIHALSIQNEPHFTQPYDSCIYAPEEMRDAIILVAAAFKRWNVKTLLMAPEDFADDPRWMKYVALITSGKSPPAVSILNLHGEPEGDGGAARHWPKFATLAKQTKLPIWMTETSGEEPAWLAQDGKRGALDLARSIHDALVFGQCEAWVYWAIADPTPSRFSLMSLAEPTAKYHAAKHYFKFIRPGASRIHVNGTASTTLASAFHHETRREVSIVLINTAAADAPVRLDLASPPGTIEAFDPIRSSSAESGKFLEAVTVRDKSMTLVLPPQSVTTLFAKY